MPEVIGARGLPKNCGAPAPKLRRLLQVSGGGLGGPHAAQAHAPSRQRPLLSRSSRGPRPPIPEATCFESGGCPRPKVRHPPVFRKLLGATAQKWCKSRIPKAEENPPPKATTAPYSHSRKGPSPKLAAGPAPKHSRHRHSQSGGGPCPKVTKAQMSPKLHGPEQQSGGAAYPKAPEALAVPKQ